MKALKNKTFRISKVEGNFSFFWTDWRCEMKKYYRQVIAFLLVWICSGVTMYSYQVENKILGITFTFLSFLYWFIIDKDD